MDCKARYSPASKTPPVRDRIAHRIANVTLRSLASASYLEALSTVITYGMVVLRAFNGDRKAVDTLRTIIEATEADDERSQSPETV